MVNKWFSLLDTTISNTDSLVYLYNADKYVTEFYLEPRFLNMVQALDLYYDRKLSKNLSVGSLFDWKVLNNCLMIESSIH
jgi:hypothetical protein